MCVRHLDAEKGAMEMEGDWDLAESKSSHPEPSVFLGPNSPGQDCF